MDDNKYRTIIIKPSLWKLCVAAFFSTPVILVIAFFIQLLIWPNIEIQFDIVVLILLIITLMGGVLLQIYILPVALLLFSKIYSSEISLGFSKRYLSYYSINMVKLKVYKSSILMIFFITGILPLITGIATNIPFLTILGSIGIDAGIIQMIIFIPLRKVPGDSLLCDYPDKLGCEVYVRKDV